MFVKYPHISRVGDSEVTGILDGTCFVFPKLDGTNASIFAMDGTLCAGSRNCQLSTHDDNAGFYNHIMSSTDREKYAQLLHDFPFLTLYGEWLVPHTVKTYNTEAWRKFYIFDVYDRSTDQFVHYLTYSTLLKTYGIPCIPAVRIDNPSMNTLKYYVENNTYLLSEGIGEGIVIKNYDFVNRYGRYAIAKMVATEFTQKNGNKVSAIPLSVDGAEAAIVQRFCTPAFIEKTYQKILHSFGDAGWDSRKGIPWLLETVWHDFLIEEIYEIWKNNKKASIQFSELKRYVDQKVKETLTNIF